MSQPNPVRRRLAVLTAVAGIAATLVVVPVAAAPAFASDSSTTSSLFQDVNTLRTSIAVGQPALAPNGYANIRAHELAVLYSHCGACNPDDLSPADAAPSTPQAPVYDIWTFAHVSTGSHEASRLLTKLLANGTYADQIESVFFNVGGVGVYTHGSKVYGMVEMLGYNPGHLPGGYLKVSKPTITGTVAVGHLLTAHHDAAVPDNGDTSGINYTYDWRSGSTSYGSGPTFHVPASLEGQHIYVLLSVQKGGFIERDVPSDNTSAAKAGTFSLSGKYKMGQLGYALLGIVPTTVTPSPTSTYKWYLNGHAIGGATSVVYAPVAGDIGKQISEKITLSSPGYTTMVVTVKTATQFPGLQFWGGTPAPTITGSHIVGDTLTSSVTTWSPTPSSTTITWRANGVAISGAHAATFVLTHAQLGKKITVTYKFALALFETTSSTSGSTPKVQAAP